MRKTVKRSKIYNSNKKTGIYTCSIKSLLIN